MKYFYHVTQPMLPPGAESPVMSHRDMEWWLNDMQSSGWEFMGYGATHWVNNNTQDWWIFRKLVSKLSKAEKQVFNIKSPTPKD